MCEFPVKHGSHAVRTDHQVAVAKVSMHQARLHRRRRATCGQLMESQVKYRTADAVSTIGGMPLFDEIGRRLTRQAGKSAGIDGVDARQNLPAGIRQGFACAGQRCRFDDTSAERLAGNKFHDESVTQAILGCEYVQHFRHRYAAVSRRGDQLSLDIEPNPDRRRSVAAGCTAQDQRLRSLCRVKVESPNLLRRTTGEPHQSGNAARRRTKARRKRRERGADRVLSTRGGIHRRGTLLNAGSSWWGPAIPLRGSSETIIIESLCLLLIDVSEKEQDMAAEVNL